MDVSYGTDGSHACTEPFYRNCGVVRIPGTSNFCHAYSAFKSETFRENLQAGKRQYRRQYIFPPNFDCLPVCDCGMGAVVVFVGAYVGKTFCKPVYKFVFYTEFISVRDIFRQFYNYFHKFVFCALHIKQIKP